MKKFDSFVNEEVGIRNIKSIIGPMKTAEIYFHKDLDGVTSALAMKYFLETYYQVKTVDAHQIQYGGMEFAIKNHKEGNLCVLVDFAHGKPMFAIQSDHHDKQVGAGDTEATYFKSARSNVEIISGEISYSPAFTSSDIELIKTVDSADFFRNNIQPEDIQKSIFELDKELSGEKNRFIMGFCVNRLLLAYKNKRITVKSIDGKRDHINKNILECMVLDCTPSLISMFVTLRHYMNNARVADKAGVLAKPDELKKNIDIYIDKMKNYRFIEDPKTGNIIEYDPTTPYSRVPQDGKIHKGVHFDETYKIIIQYGGGSMIKPGSYDRYVPFKNNPDANFLCIVWPLGLIQVSCNPFKEKKLKDIDLGKIAKEVMSKHMSKLSDIFVTLDCLKKEFETSQDWKKMQKEEGPDYSGVGFRYSDLEAFYMDCIYSNKSGEMSNILDEVLEIDFMATDETYQNIKVKISFDGKDYYFNVTDTKSIKDFVDSALVGNVEKYNVPTYLNFADVKEVESELVNKQIEGAKNTISNLLKSENTIVSKKEKVSIFRSVKDQDLKTAMNTTYDKLTPEQMSVLKSYSIACWELITRNSGGHPSITNLQGWGFLKYNKEGMLSAYKVEKYTDVMKLVAREFVDNLKEKIEKSEKGQSVNYDTKGVEFTGQDVNESFEYHLLDKEGKVSKVTKSEFVNAGFGKAMRPEKLVIDDKNRKIIAKFENFKYKK